MSRHGLAVVLFPILLFAASGCAAVAATVAGGAVIAGATYALDNSVDETLSVPLPDAKAITEQAIADFGMSYSEAESGPSGCKPTHVEFDAFGVGDDLVNVRVELVKISKDATRVRVKADKGWLRPDRPTAEAVMRHIHASARDYNSRTVLMGKEHV